MSFCYDEAMIDSDHLTSVLRSARDAVDAADLPPDLRVSAFERALGALLGDPVGGDEAGNTLDSDDGLSLSGDTSPAAKKAAAKLRVDEHLLMRVLDFDEDGVHIIVPRSRLAKAKSEAVQQVALLTVGGRQGSGLDPEGWTHQGLVREATEVLGVDDHSNFAVHMKRLTGVRARGSGRTGELKMNAVGFEAAGDLVKSLASEADG